MGTRISDIETYHDHSASRERGHSAKATSDCPTALQQKRQPIVRPAARPATPPDLAPLTRYTCPKCQATFDGLNSFPPITDRVNDHLRTVGSPELSALEKSFLHRRWWGSHDCEDPSYIMFYLNTVFEWRGD